MLCEATCSRSDKSLLFFSFLFFGCVKSGDATRALSLVLSLRVEGKNGIKRYDITTEQTGFATY